MRYTAKGKAMAWLDFTTMKPVESGFYLLFELQGDTPFIYTAFYDSTLCEWRKWESVLSLSGTPLNDESIKNLKYWAKITDPTD